MATAAPEAPEVNPLTAPTLNPAQLQVGTANGPGLWIAPAGTALPLDTKTAPATPWQILGYCSDDGPTVGQSTDSNDITPWQSRVPLRTVVTAKAITMQFVLWQLNEITLALYFDQDVPTVGVGGEVDLVVKSAGSQHLYAAMIDSKDGPNVLRVGFTRCSLSDAGDMQIQAGAAVPLDVTLSALDDGGNFAKVMYGPAT